MRIQSATDLFNDRLKILVYGQSGAGKTYLARTIEEPTLVISAESGLLSLSGANIDVLDITTDDDGKLIPAALRFSQMQKAYQYLLTEEAKQKYKWIFIDSLTEVSQNLIESLLPEFPDRKDALVMYGENFKRMRNMIKAFRDIPHYNIVFTALAEEEKDQNGKRYHGVSMIGKMSSQLPSFLDEVFYLHTFSDDDNVLKRRLVTQPTDKAVAKDRSGKLDKFEEANLKIIATKIKEKKDDKSIGSKSAVGVPSAASGGLPSASAGSTDDRNKGRDGQVRQSKVPNSGGDSNRKSPVA